MEKYTLLWCEAYLQQNWSGIGTSNYFPRETNFKICTGFVPRQWIMHLDSNRQIKLSFLLYFVKKWAVHKKNCFFKHIAKKKSFPGTPESVLAPLRCPSSVMKMAGSLRVWSDGPGTIITKNIPYRPDLPYIQNTIPVTITIQTLETIHTAISKTDLHTKKKIKKYIFKYFYAILLYTWEIVENYNENIFYSYFIEPWIQPGK